MIKFSLTFLWLWNKSYISPIVTFNSLHLYFSKLPTRSQVTSPSATTPIVDKIYLTEALSKSAHDVPFPSSSFKLKIVTCPPDRSLSLIVDFTSYSCHSFFSETELDCYRSKCLSAQFFSFSFFHRQSISPPHDVLISCLSAPLEPPVSLIDFRSDCASNCPDLILPHSGQVLDCAKILRSLQRFQVKSQSNGSTDNDITENIISLLFYETQENIFVLLIIYRDAEGLLSTYKRIFWYKLIFSKVSSYTSWNFLSLDFLL